MNQRMRVPLLDLARLIAAAGVMIFHFGFHGGVTHRYLDAYQPSLGAWSRYGYLGVDVFFVISGFVIAWSARGASAASFAWRRWLRVYPTFLFCVAVTSTVIVLARDPHFQITWRQLLAHVIVDPRRFRLEFIDGAYWTIVCELQFYAFVALGLAVPQLRKHATHCILAWFALTLLNEYVLDLRMVRYAFVTQWSCFFMLGMAVFRLKTQGPAFTVAAFAVAAFAVGVHLELRDAAVRFLIAPDYSPFIVGAVLVSSIALLIFSMRFRFAQRTEKVLQRLGSVSYPLYLLHGTIGYILINRLAPALGLPSALLVASATLVALASGVAFVVEPRLKAWCSDLRLRLAPRPQVEPAPQVDLASR